MYIPFINEAVFLDSIGKIIVFLMLMFVIFLVTVKSDKRLPNYLFAAFLLVTAFDLCGLFLGETISNYTHLHHLKIASSLLQMPLFFLYVCSVCYSDFKLLRKQLAHSALFWIFLGIFTLGLVHKYQHLLFELAGELQYLAYILAIFYTLNRHKTVYLENYSNPDYTAYKWLFQATVLFCVAHIFVVARMIIEFTGAGDLWSSWINVIISISALTVTCWLVMKAMYQPHIFKGVSTQLAPIKTIESKTRLSETSPEVNRIRTFMSTQKPYLDYELSLEKLAQQMEIGDKELSLLINHSIGKHFFDFVNHYRIEEAKALLANPAQSQLTVQEILYQVGFNSKSSFYTAFKKETGVTPIKYRKSIS